MHPAETHSRSLPLLNVLGVKPQPIVRKRKAAYTHRAQEIGGQKQEASLAPPAGDIRVRAPEITVEQADASDELSKRGRGRPRK